MTDQRQEVLRVATDLFEQKNLDWMTFFREVLGLEGVVRKAYPSQEAYEAFERSEEYQQIQQMVAKLREKDVAATDSDKEPIRVITVRLPKSLHETLKNEAHERHTSMNKLCISKLLQVVDDELVPVEAGMEVEG